MMMAGDRWDLYAWLVSYFQSTVLYWLLVAIEREISSIAFNG